MLEMGSLVEQSSMLLTRFHAEFWKDIEDFLGLHPSRYYLEETCSSIYNCLPRRRIAVSPDAFVEIVWAKLLNPDLLRICSNQPVSRPVLDAIGSQIPLRKRHVHFKDYIYGRSAEELMASEYNSWYQITESCIFQDDVEFLSFLFSHGLFDPSSPDAVAYDWTQTLKECSRFRATRCERWLHQRTHVRAFYTDNDRYAHERVPDRLTEEDWIARHGSIITDGLVRRISPERLCVLLEEGAAIEEGTVLLTPIFEVLCKTGDFCRWEPVITALLKRDPECGRTPFLHCMYTTAFPEYVYRVPVKPLGFLRSQGPPRRSLWSNRKVMEVRPLLKFPPVAIDTRDSLIDPDWYARTIDPEEAEAFNRLVDLFARSSDDDGENLFGETALVEWTSECPVLSGTLNDRRPETIENIHIMLNGCANVNAAIEDGVTALYHCVWFWGEMSEQAKFLLENGALVAPENGRSCLVAAASWPDSQELLSSLLGYASREEIDRIDHFAVKPEGYAAIHMAAEKGTLETVSLLNERKANLNLGTGLFHQTPIQIALLRQDPVGVSIAEHLAGSGADLNARDVYGRTCLFVACILGNDSMVNWLLTNGADPGIPDIHGVLPVDISSFCSKSSEADCFSVVLYEGQSSSRRMSAGGHRACLEILASVSPFAVTHRSDDFYKQTYRLGRRGP
jgi:hypothetical protein